MREHLRACLREYDALPRCSPQDLTARKAHAARRDWMAFRKRTRELMETMQIWAVADILELAAKLRMATLLIQALSQWT